MSDSASAHNHGPEHADGSSKGLRPQWISVFTTRPFGCLLSRWYALVQPLPAGRFATVVGYRDRETWAPHRWVPRLHWEPRSNLDDPEFRLDRHPPTYLFEDLEFVPFDASSSLRVRCEWVVVYVDDPDPKRDWLVHTRYAPVWVTVGNNVIPHSRYQQEDGQPMLFDAPWEPTDDSGFQLPADLLLFRRVDALEGMRSGSWVRTDRARTTWKRSP